MRPASLPGSPSTQTHKGLLLQRQVKMGFEKYKFTRLSLTLPWQNGENGDRKKPRKTINIFMGFFFMVNFCLGTGFLGIPYSFFYSGLLAGMPTLILVGFVSWLNANWSVECMARAQVSVLASP